MSQHHSKWKNEIDFTLTEILSAFYIWVFFRYIISWDNQNNYPNPNPFQILWLSSNPFHISLAQLMLYTKESKDICITLTLILELISERHHTNLKSNPNPNPKSNCLSIPVSKKMRLNLLCRNIVCFLHFSFFQICNIMRQSEQLP